MAGDARAGGEGQKIIVPVRVSGGSERDGAERTLLGGVGGIGRLKQGLDILTKRHANAVVVGRRRAGDKGKGTEVAGDAVAPRKLVEPAGDIGDDVDDE